jgi:hypothetical protein
VQRGLRNVVRREVDVTAGFTTVGATFSAAKSKIAFQHVR